MRILTGGGGSTAQYTEHRGPTGERFAAWKDGIRDRMLARYGYEPGDDGAKPMDAVTRRRLRNARKQERREERAR